MIFAFAETTVDAKEEEEKRRPTQYCPDNIG
jgi:hypothetical protein